MTAPRPPSFPGAGIRACHRREGDNTPLALTPTPLPQAGEGLTPASSASRSRDDAVFPHLLVSRASPQPLACMAHSQFDLLRQRRFLPFFVTQCLGAFNDNVYRQAIIGLLFWL